MPVFEDDRHRKRLFHRKKQLLHLRFHWRTTLVSDARYETHIQSSAAKANEICGLPVSPMELTWFTPDDLDVMDSDPYDEEDGFVVDDVDALETRSSDIYVADLMESLDHLESESDTSDSEETLNVESTVIGEDDEPLCPDLLREPVRWMKLSDLHVSRKACYITFLHLTL